MNDEFVEPVIQVEGKDYALVDLKAYLEDYGKEGYEFSYAVDGKAVANFPVGGMAMIENIDSDVRIDITVTAPSVTNGNATLIVADNDATAQYISQFATTYRFLVDLTGLDVADELVAEWNETVYINGEQFYSNREKSAPVEVLAAAQGLVEDDTGLRINAGDKVEVIVTDVVVTEYVPDVVPTLTVGNTDAKVYVDNSLVDPTANTPAGKVYDIKEGSKVVVAGLSVTAGEKYILSDKETVATVNDRGQLVFEMPKADIDLSDKVRGYTIVDLGEGITLNGGDVEEGDVVATGTNLTVTSTTGDYMVKLPGTVGYIDTTATAVADDNTIEVTGDLRIYAAVAISVYDASDSYIDVNVKNYDGTTTELGSNTYIAVGAEYTAVLNDTANEDWGIVNGTTVSEDYNGVTKTVGEKDTLNFATGWKITLGEGVTAGAKDEYGTGDVLAVFGSTTAKDINLKSDATNVIAEPAENLPYSTTAVADTDDFDGFAGATLVAATKVTVPSGATVTYQFGTISADVDLNSGTVIYVLPTTELYVTVSGATGLEVKGGVETETSGNNANFFVGTEEITVSTKA